ncbi:MAG: (Fe-S)-binding protein [Cyclobacteriaceae bacterium]|nr:(Fe-S)-binding protein [Cyclobacteriaceae bacterium]
MIQQIAFSVVLLVAGFFLRQRILFIRNTIRLGKENTITDRPGDRWQNVLLVAFGQKKMFKRPLPALLHFFIYGGFLIINLEVLEFVIDGLAGTHRIFAPWLGPVYPLLMNLFEFLAVAVMTACVLFLLRRFVLKLPRFWSAEMTAWPRLDAALILVTEIILMWAILFMNASDQLLQGQHEHYTATGRLFFSSFLMPVLNGTEVSSLVMIERFCWWFHIVGILGFSVYITYSKHLHIFLAFPNTYYARLEPKGYIQNMPVVTREVRSMLGLEASTAPSGEPGRFGAKDINDLTWNTLLSAYACTECGRCTSECPANQTGKKLSPRKIMMDVRDRMEEVGKRIKRGEPGFEDGKSLLGNYVTKEEINACTSCNACVEACPVMISPLDIILEMRRYVAMEESGSPAQWNSMFQNIETNFAPWKFPAADRFNWSKENS